MSRPVDRVVVVGRDAAAWLTALALQRAFGRTGLKVVVAELPSILSPVDAYVSMPTLGGLHQLLGLDETEVMAACSGVYALAQRFANWSGGKAPFLHAYDTQPMGVNNVDLVQYWVRARSEGMKVPFEAFSLGAAMASQGRMARNFDLTPGFAAPAWGMHLDARSYVDLLRRRALESGVERIAGSVDSVEVEGERIISVQVGQGAPLTADLFVDASGGQAALIGRLPGAEFQSWRRWLPCDRLLTASAKPLDPLPGYSQIAAFRAGWIGLYPLQDRTAVVACYDSSTASDRDVLEALPVLSGLTLQGEAVASAFEAGVRERAWVGNCVAIGEAAVSLEPLDALQPHVIQTGLSLLISLFPTDAERPVEAAAYNTAIASHAARMRDFQAAHYKLNQRRDEPFWDRARKAEPPEALAYKIDLFGARGRVAIYDDEAFQAPNWTSIFIGHGLIPRDYDPLVDQLNDQEQIVQLQRTLEFIADEVKAMPTLQSQLQPVGRGAFS